MRTHRWIALPLLSALLACGGSDEPPGVMARLRVDDDAGFFDAPFPIAHRSRSDGGLRVADFPNPRDNPTLTQLLTLLEEGRGGFSLNGAILIPFEAPIAVSRLPADPLASIGEDSPVFLVDVTASSPSYGQRIPIVTGLKREAETYSPANLLVALPYQGMVLAPATTYALVVRRGLGDDQGRPLYPPEALEILLQGGVPAGSHGQELADAFAPLRAWLVDAAIGSGDVAAATVFTTGQPGAEMVRWQAQVAAQPAAPATGVALVDDYDDYCVVSAAVSLPVFQRGPKPYADFGSGVLVSDDEGLLIEQERDEATIILTIPHGPMPTEGFPLVIYAAGAEGKARQVVDRTAIDADPDEGLGPPGQGPARYYGARGIAALGFPAPLTWDRHPDGLGGLLDFWNVANLGAFRDNLRQGILDITTLIQLAKTIEIDASLCPAASSPSGTFRYDPHQLFLHGHSTGSTIGSASIALEPELRAAVLSGAGGSWIYNVVRAESPLKLSTVAGLLLDYDYPDLIDELDPVVTLFQTALEPVEVMDWGRHTVQSPLPGSDPKHVLLIEGVIDSYHFPRMVNAYGMSVGLDLVEPLVAAEEESALADYAMVGRGVLPAPMAANVDVPGGDVTAATVQRAQNHQDGHYVPFEHEDVKYRYSCFLASLVSDGLPTVPPPNDDGLAPCP